MARKLSRRDFIKAAAGTAVAASAGPKAGKLLLEPFVRPPEEVLPGRATWYASTCGQCAAGCGIIVRVINGRAKKIEGNPLHPLNRGKLCARGQAGLQALYNPDRLKNAVVQTGGRGSRIFEPIYWPEALDLLAEKITSLGSPKRLAFWGGLMPAHLYRLTKRFLDALGAPPLMTFDLHSALEGRAAARRLSEHFFGSNELPIYDIARSEVIFSFGANFLETWMSPVSQSRAYGDLRSGQFGGRGFIAQFEPRLSATAASADEWIPVRPGTEGLIALAIGRIIIEERIGSASAHRTYGNLYQNVDIRTLAEATEMPVQALRRLAHIFADADQAVAIPGGYLAGQRNGLTSMRAVLALNLLVAQIGRTGGVFLSQPGQTAALDQRPQTDPFSEALNLIERMKAGDVDLLLVHGANPSLELENTDFKEAAARVPFVVSFSPFVDDTAVGADLILPDHTYLESWGYQIPMPGADRPVVSNQQPVVQPLYDTRSTGDVLLSLAARIGGPVAEALPWPDVTAMLQETAMELQGSSLSVYDARTPAGFWALWRQHGGWWSERPIRREPESADFAQENLPVVEPEFEGDPESFPLHLYPYASIALSDGRGANLPWLQETPDPMTTARWRSWVELNPETAENLGVHDNDIVRVISQQGELEAQVVVFPGIRPDVIAIPIGWGHKEYGRFARGRGSNPMALVAPVVDPDSGALAWGATRVRVERTDRHEELARLESLDGEGRETLR